MFGNRDNQNLYMIIIVLLCVIFLLSGALLSVRSAARVVRAEVKPLGEKVQSLTVSVDRLTALVGPDLVMEAVLEAASLRETEELLYNHKARVLLRNALEIPYGQLMLGVLDEQRYTGILAFFEKYPTEEHIVSIMQ